MTWEQIARAALGLLAVAVAFWLDIRREGWPWKK